MPAIYEVELQQKVDYFLKVYSQIFKQIFNAEPDITDIDRSTTRQLLNRIKITKPEIKPLIEGYLALEDEWVKGQGFPLRLIERQYNAIITRAGRQGRAPKENWIVGITESGILIEANDPNIMGPNYPFKPIRREIFELEKLEKKQN